MTANGEFSVVPMAQKPRGRLGELVAVGIPHLQTFRQAGESDSPGAGSPAAVTVLTALAVSDLAAEEMPHELHAVADTEDGQAEGEDGAVGQRGGLGQHAGGAAGEDDAHHAVRPQRLGAGVEKW